MGLFSSLFGQAGSDKADKMRQQAIDAFNSIQTPQLKDLQVQLDQEVNAGSLTPEQAEAQLLNSNAFNSIKTDPSLTGAAKQALTQLQQIGSQGGMTAIDKAQLQDITNQTNQLAQSRNASVMQDAQQRGIGGSGLELANTLSNEQNAANTASNAGTQVAANAQQRALQAIQSAGGLGQSLESQAYGEQANKAQAQNAIDLFNTQTANATNLYNTGTANQAQAQNLANAQNIANTNTGIANTNKTYNAAQNQQIFNDQAAKAAGLAGQYDQWANAAQASKNQETGADMALLGGALKAGATAGGAALGGPAGAAAASGSMDIGSGNTTNKNYQMNPDGSYNFAEGGEVSPNENHGMVASNAEPENKFSHECYSKFCLHPEHAIDMKAPLNENKGLSHAEAEPENKSLEDAYNNFIKSYCYGGSVKMADGGMVNIKAANKEPIRTTEPHSEGYAKGGIAIKPSHEGLLHKNLGVPVVSPIPSGKLEKATHSSDPAVKKRAIFAENAKHWNHKADGGVVESTGTAKGIDPAPAKEEKKDTRTFADKLSSLISSHADIANDIDNNQTGKIQDFRNGGQVPGIPKVPGDSPKNDVVPAKLSPGEIVLPRTVVQNPVKVPNFVKQTLTKEEPTSIALRRLRQAHLNQGA